MGTFKSATKKTTDESYKQSKLFLMIRLSLTVFILILSGCTPKSKPSFEGVWEFKNGGTITIKTISKQFYEIKVGETIGMAELMNDVTLRIINESLETSPNFYLIENGEKLIFLADTLYRNNKN